MKSVAADFASEAEAAQAVNALQAAGVAKARIRVWNIIPESGAARPASGGTVAGAATGALLGGAGGLVAGAALGALWEGGSGEGAGLPPPSGVRVVVDAEGSGDEVTRVLREAGAQAIHENNAT